MKASLTHHSGRVPADVKVLMYATWTRLLLVRVVFMILGLVVSPIVLALARYRRCNAFGEGYTPYRKDRYPKSSDKGWEFHSINPEWKKGNYLQRFLWLFGNDEDGFYGDKYGKWSGITNKKERSLWSQFKWNFLRNPCNNLSRYTSMFSVDVNKCDLEYWGSYQVGSPGDNKEYYIIGTDRSTGNKYYGYRNSDGIQRGNKLKPSHAEETQPDDNKDRGFTFRF